MKYSTHLMCHCRGEDGRLLGQKCPQLRRQDGSPNFRHASGGWAMRLPTTKGIKQVKRYGYTSMAGHRRRGPARDQAAGTGRGRASHPRQDWRHGRRREAGRAAAHGRRRPPPPGARARSRLTGRHVRRGVARLARGQAALRRSSRERIEQIGEHWLLPVLADVPLERLNGGHCAEVFGRIGRINAAITTQQGDGRAYVHVEGDVRERPRLVGTATQHRVYAALREFCNFEMKHTRRLSYNPVYAVELEPEVTPEAQRWDAGQVRVFLAASHGDPLALLFRVILLFGPRRGEAIGLRWSGGPGRRLPQGGPHGAARRRRRVRQHAQDPGRGTVYWLDLDHRAAGQHRKVQRRARIAAGGRGRTAIWCSATTMAAP